MDAMQVVERIRVAVIEVGWHRFDRLTCKYYFYRNGCILMYDGLEIQAIMYHIIVYMDMP